jgi:hypothetical protein
MCVERIKRNLKRHTVGRPLPMEVNERRVHFRETSIIIKATFYEFNRFLLKHIPRYLFRSRRCACTGSGQQYGILADSDSNPRLK